MVPAELLHRVGTMVIERCYDRHFQLISKEFVIIFPFKGSSSSLIIKSPLSSTGKEGPNVILATMATQSWQLPSNATHLKMDA